MKKKILILGGGGFIGSHLAQRMIAEGHHVRCVDLKYNQFFGTYGMEFIIGDLRDPKVVETVFDWDVDEVYMLAESMGGAGFVFTGANDADIIHSSCLLHANIAKIAVEKRAKKLFFSSSACALNQDFQTNPINNPLTEDMAWPANPDSVYGKSKLFAEELYLSFAKNYGLNIRIARFHNIFGQETEFYTGKEKAPAAMCRKVILAAMDKKKTIDVWGTGKQVRSFLHIHDCLNAIGLLMESDHKEPINIGSAEYISINDLARMFIRFSGEDISINNIKSNAIGVAGRSSDNTMIKKVLNWEPEVSLSLGMMTLYNWMKEYIRNMPFIFERNPDTKELKRSITDLNTPEKVQRYYLKS